MRQISFRAPCAAAACGAVLAACGGGAVSAPSPEQLQVSPQNSTLLKGENRVSIALLDEHQNPVHVSDSKLQVLSPSGALVGTDALQSIAPVYGGIPVYVGVVEFPDVGQFEFRVSARSTQGQPVSGHAYVTVQPSGHEVPIGSKVPLVRQPIIGDPGVTISKIDSGVPPDDWHTTTVAQGVAEHRPMVLYFGDPAYCPSRTCGPTRDILEQLCGRYCERMLFEHIETYYPAGPPSTGRVNPAFSAFGLSTDPWIYFVNAQGIVADRYEGPVTLAELEQSAQGTLAGKVPAVTLSSAAQ